MKNQQSNKRIFSINNHKDTCKIKSVGVDFYKDKLSNEDINGYISFYTDISDFKSLSLIVVCVL